VSNTFSHANPKRERGPPDAHGAKALACASGYYHISCAGFSLATQDLQQAFKIVVGLEAKDDLPLVPFAEADLNSRRQALA
jgi:hypothetical protein